MIKVAAVEADSDAERAGILPGDKILKINEEEVRDRLDFEFHRSGGFLDFEIMRGENVMRVSVERDEGQVLGIEPEVMKIHLCKNNCVFCFVHQTPKGMRKSLYVKDEDYRYSFLDGHFTTLSNMKESDWARVLEQKLSPIYVSVHCTEPEMRAKLLKNDKLEPVLDRLSWMRKHRIAFHTQMVVIPDWNDKEYLERSLRELRPYFPDLLSISVVPIGLTSHRKNLPDLRLCTREDALDILERVERHGREVLAETGEMFIFPSDELYILAGVEVPQAEFYGDFSQYENGVGTIRTLKDDFARELPFLPKARPDWEITVLTAPLAEGTQRGILDTLRQEKGLKSELLICENLTFGSTVTVTGLLCGKDFAAALERSQGKGPVLIPPNSLNKDNLFLDDMSPKDLEARFGRKVMAPNSFREYFPV
ncbi:MAG: putative radical enzyme family [Fibrobacteres bacterium]|nr:putative radical enzyme family [Fibrobacterota bacterium]